MQRTQNMLKHPAVAGLVDYIVELVVKPCKLVGVPFFGVELHQLQLFGQTVHLLLGYPLSSPISRLTLKYLANCEYIVYIVFGYGLNH